MSEKQRKENILMILALDVGNTHVVLGGIENGQCVSIARLATDAGKTDYEYAVLMRDVLNLAGVELDTIEGCIISSVVPPVTVLLKDAYRILRQDEALVVGAGIKTGLDIRIDDPATLGADLVVGAVGSLSLAKPPIIIVDMGTATTLFAVGPKNTFLGGVIAPGVKLSINALAGGTSQLSSVNIAAPKKVIGTNTEDCILAGVVIGHAAMMDGLIERMEAELGQSATVIATGGLSSVVAPFCKHEMIVEPQLLLKGMAVLWEKNRK